MTASKRVKTAKPRQRNARGEGERLRAELIDAAIRVLAALGPQEPFSLRAVAKEAKVAAPSVYLHFADLNMLLLAVLERLFAEQIALRDAAEDEAAHAGGGAWERLLARSLAYVRFGLANTGHYRVLFEGRVVPRLDNPRAAAFGQPILERSVELIREILPRRHKQDPQHLALILWAGLHGIVSLRINKPTFDWPEAEALAEEFMRSLLRPA